MTRDAPETVDLQEVLIAPPLRIRYLAGRSQRLVVSVSGVGNERHVEPPLEFFKLAGWNGENHVLFITDESRSWLNKPGMAEQIVAVIKATAAQIGATQVVGLGNSMGGTMLLHLSRFMTFEAVIALVPQYSVDPVIVPEETRWHFFRRQIKEYRFRVVEKLPMKTTHFLILHGDTKDELIHALRFPDPAGMDHFILPGFNHSLARVLHQDHLLCRIVTDAMLGQRWRLRRAVRAVGGISRTRYEKEHRGLDGKGVFA